MWAASWKKRVWYLLEDIERTHQTKEDTERERLKEEMRKQDYERYKQRRIEKFFDFFDEDKSDSINAHEFVKGLHLLLEPDSQQILLEEARVGLLARGSTNEAG